MKRMKALLWLWVCAIMMSCACAAVTVKAEDSPAVGSFTQEESYLTKKFQDLYKANDLEIATDIAVTENSSANGILLTGDASTFAENKIKINQTFSFTGNRLGRVAVDALAAYGENLKISFYLDDENESFASFTLKKQGRSNLWTKDVNLQKDVLDQNITGTHTISFSIDNSDDGETQVLLRSIEFVESGSPTIYIDVDESLGAISDMNNSTNNTDVCYGDMSIETPSGYTYEYGEHAYTSASEDSKQTYELDQMHLYGLSESDSVNYQKTYELYVSQKINPFGMTESDHWILLDQMYDYSHMRSQLAFRLGRDLGLEYTPECVSVELVINGIYYGNYLFVNLLDLSDNHLISVFQEDTFEELSTFTTEQDMHCEVMDSELDSSTIADIQSYIQNMENALYNRDYADYMDVDSAIDNYWIQEVSCRENNLSKAESTFIYTDASGIVHWAPLWGFEEDSWNNEEMNDEAEDFSQFSKCWFYQLVRDPDFAAGLVDRWPAVKEKLQSYCEDGGLIDQYYDNMLISMRYNVEYMYTLYDEVGAEAAVSFSEAKEELKSWVQKRLEWIDSSLEDSALTPVKLTYMIDGDVYLTEYALKDICVETIPDSPSKDGYIFTGWYYTDEYGDEAVLETNCTFTEDTILKARYVSEEDVINPTSLYIDYNEMWIYVDSGYDYYNLQASVYPKDAYGNINYVSSDENVLKVDSGGELTGISAGDATVTVTVGNLKKTCLVHVYDPGTSALNYVQATLATTSLTLKPGQWSQLNVNLKEGFNYISWQSLDEDIAEVDPCGVVYANDYGTTNILMISNGKITKCKVTVPKPASTIKKGYVYTYKGLKYKVTSKAKKGGTVTILGSNSKKITRVNIRSTLTIKGETYKVTGISAKAFYKCKKLRTITMGKNIKSIGNKAFTGIYKKAVFKVPASKKKAYKKLLTSKKGFKKTMKIRK